MKTATLNQGLKILSYLEDVSSEQIQKTIESGLLAQVIRSGELLNITQYVASDKIKCLWELIGVLTNYERISITVPHAPYQSTFEVMPRDREAFQEHWQVRCWKAYSSEAQAESHGMDGGHVDSCHGLLLFETRLPKCLDSCGCCFPQQLSAIGIQSPQTRVWVRKTIEVGNRRGSFDILTIGDRA